MHTEKMAREKICPHLPVDHEHNCETRDVTRVIHFAKCVAGDCMMWRWTGEWNNEGKDDLKPKGYCGLAARP